MNNNLLHAKINEQLAVHKLNLNRFQNMFLYLTKCL